MEKVTVSMNMTEMQFRRFLTQTDDLRNAMLAISMGIIVITLPLHFAMGVPHDLGRLVFIALMTFALPCLCLFGYLHKRKQDSRNYRNANITHDKTCVISSDGITLYIDEKSTFLPFGELSMWRETKDFIVIYLAPNSLLGLQKTSFSKENDVQQAVGYLSVLPRWSRKKQASLINALTEHSGSETPTDSNNPK